MEQRLETLLEASQSEGEKPAQRGIYSRAYNAATNYLVDVSAGWTFYTPLNAAIEYGSGMDTEQVIKSRTAGLLAQALIMRPAGMIRNYLSKKWNVTSESPWYQKTAVTAAGVLPLQAAVYAGMLAYVGADLKQASMAMAGTLATSLAVSYPFGKWQDKWRKLWGKKPAIK